MSFLRCGECGAEFRLGPTPTPTVGVVPAACPLCGGRQLREVGTASRPQVERYQAEIRRLRRQLKDAGNDDARAV